MLIILIVIVTKFNLTVVALTDIVNYSFYVSFKNIYYIK